MAEKKKRSEEMETARRAGGYMMARVTANGTPTEEEVQALPRDYYGNPMNPEDLFIFSAEPSNSFPDSYWTYMCHDTLLNYMQDAIEGQALMDSHRHEELPLGVSFNGQVVPDPSAITREPWLEFLLPGSEPFSRLRAQYYIDRKGNVARVANADAIRAIEMRTARWMSAGFLPGDVKCNLCGGSILDWECEHIPGIAYPMGEITERERAQKIVTALRSAGKPDKMARCLGGITGGHLAEASLVYKGATPQAAVIPAYVLAKARMVAEGGGLTPVIASQINRLEGTLGVRMVDPAVMSAVPRVFVPASTPKKATTIDTDKKENKNMALLKKRDATGDPAADPAALAQVVADQSTTDAAAIAAQIDALNQEIAALQQQADALQSQIDNPPADPSGNPMDTTDLQTEHDGLLAQISSKTDQVTALQAELDGVNQTAQATGGQPSDPQSAGQGGAQPPAPGQAALKVMRALQGEVSKLKPLERAEIPDDALNQLIDMVNQIASALQSFVSAQTPPPSTGSGTGTNAATVLRFQNAVRSPMDRVIFSAIARRLEGRAPTFADVKNMLEDAEAGKEYRKTLIDEAVAARNRALGPNDDGAYRSMAEKQSVEFLRDEIATYAQRTGETFTARRTIITPSMAEAVDETVSEDNESNVSGTSTPRMGRGVSRIAG